MKSKFISYTSLYCGVFKFSSSAILSVRKRVSLRMRLLLMAAIHVLLMAVIPMAKSINMIRFMINRFYRVIYFRDTSL